MLTERKYSLRQLQSEKTTVVDSKSSKHSKSLSLKSSKKSADSKNSKSSKKSSKTAKSISDKSDKSHSAKASKASKSMNSKALSDKSSKSSKTAKSIKDITIGPPFGSKSEKQGTGFHTKVSKDTSVFPIAKEKHIVKKSYSQMSGVDSSSSLSKLNHDVDGVKELDPLTKEAAKPSLISSTPVQLGLAVAILVISLMIHFIRMKRSKTKHSNAAGGAYKPISTGGEAEMTEMGSDDLDAEYGMDDDDDDGLGMPAQ